VSRAIYSDDHCLESLIGRTEVKDYLALQLFSFGENPSTFSQSFNNVLIYGKSGTGKTEQAKVMGNFYSQSGMFVRNQLRVVTKSEFTSSYVAESGPMTRELLYSCLDGVCFIDEAYELGPDTSMLGRTNHSSEAITEMINFLDKHEGMSVVIAAGYEEDMEARFIGSNQGMARRFPNRFNLSDYDSRQLTNILLSFLETKLIAPNYKDEDIVLGDGDASVLYTIIDYLVQKHPSKQLFDKQAGDLSNLAGMIARTVYGHRTLRWRNGDTRNNSNLLTLGVNKYLSSKGFSIKYVNSTGAAE